MILVNAKPVEIPETLAPIEAKILFLAFFGQEKIEAESGKLLLILQLFIFHKIQSAVGRGRW